MWGSRPRLSRLPLVSNVAFVCPPLFSTLSLSLSSPHTRTSSAAVIPQWGSTPSVATETSSSLEGGEEGADDDDNIAYRTVLVKLAWSFSLPLSPPSPISLPTFLSLSLSLPPYLSPCSLPLFALLTQHPVAMDVM